MPSRIDIQTVKDAVLDRIRDRESEAQRLDRREFDDIVMGAGIATSKQTLRALWAQFRYSDLNIYTGSSDKVIIIDVRKLRRECGYLVGMDTHTHRGTHMGVHTEGVQ